MNHRRTLRSLGIASLFTLASLSIFAQTDVKHPVGALHGFLTIRSQAGAYMGYAELSEYTVGDLVTVHFVYHFRDGSLDDETTTFTQRKTFQFVSDHHIQQGRFYPHPSDVTIAADGQVTVRTTEKDGKPKVETQKMDITPDFASGMVGTILQNVSSNAPEFKLGMIVPTGGKGRAIKLDVTPNGQQTFHIAGTTRKASVFRLKAELGGVAGVIAPIIGKQPPDILISVLPGDPAVIVRILGSLAEDTPILDVQLAGATFSGASSHPSAKTK